MYVGGTDERGLHHLAAEALDNAMDEAVAGFATRIELELSAEGWVTVRDNGRGIPVDPHPRFPKKSALEIILTMLHSGGKFGGNAYKVSGGLHGVGISVVNALSDALEVEVARDRRLWRQRYSRGLPLGPVEDCGPVQNRRGTTELSSRPRDFRRCGGFRPASSTDRTPRPICSAASRSAGAVTSRCRGPTGVPDGARGCTSRAGSAILGEPRRRDLLTGGPFRARPSSRMAGASNGRWCGLRTRRTAFATPIATPIPTPEGGTPRDSGCATP